MSETLKKKVGFSVTFDRDSVHPSLQDAWCEALRNIQEVMHRITHEFRIASYQLWLAEGRKRHSCGAWTDECVCTPPPTCETKECATPLT